MADRISNPIRPNVSRRSVAKSALALLAGIAASPALAADSPDAWLISAPDQLRQLYKRREVADCAYNEAQATIEKLLSPPPQCTRILGADLWFGFNVPVWQLHGNFYCDRSLDALEAWQGKETVFTATGLETRPCTRGNARRAEIVASLKARIEERRVLEIAHGTARLEAQSNELYDAYCAIVGKVAATPATTLPGVAAKTEVLRIEHGSDEEIVLRDGIFADITALAARSGNDLQAS